MRSIRTKIITAFSIILFVLTTLIFVVVFIDLNLVDRYKQSNDIIVYEQSLKKDVVLLSENGYNAFKSHDYSQYDKSLDGVIQTESILDERLSGKSINNDTKLAYRSLKNSLNAVIDIINNARDNLEKTGDIVGISVAFTDANSKFSYVEQNVDSLLVLEAINISVTTKDIESIQNFVTPIIILVIFLVFIGLIIYSISFARKITDPIITLSKTAENIINGNTDIRVSKKLLEEKDELGIL